jgi:chaperonin cofactor prefoldin
MEHLMKSLSALLIGGLISGSLAASVLGFDNESLLSGSLVSDSLKAAGDFLNDENGLSELEKELNADGNKSIAIEVQELPLTVTFVRDDENRDADAVENTATKPKSRVSGKIVIIDAEGKRKEYQFNGDQARMLHPAQNPETFEVETADGSKANGDSNSGLLPESTTEERYVIGVQCEESSELLRGHLKLGNTGLVVLEVREETPAAEAGLRKDDIIVGINDKALESLSQLVATVSESDGSPVKLIILRAGDRQEISVTPRKMQVPTMVVPARMDAEDFDELLGNANPDVRVRRIHPGLLIEGGVPGEQKDVEALIEKLRQMAESTAPAENAAARIIIAAPDQGEAAAEATAASSETQAAIKQLQEQVRQLQEQLAELQKNIQSPESENQ